MIRVWFVVISMITVIFALALRPAASSFYGDNALPGDYIQGADAYTVKVSAPLFIDPWDPNYFPPDIPPPIEEWPLDPIVIEPLPTDPGELEPLPTDPSEFETPPTDPSELEPLPTDPSELEPLPTDPSELETPPTDPSELETPPTDPSELDPMPTDPSELEPLPTDPSVFEVPLTDAEILGEIKISIDMLLMCVVFCMAGIVVYLVLRIVWPLFRGWW